MRIRYADVVGTLALVVATSGTAYAAATINSGDLVDNSVRSRDVRDGTVRLTDINDTAEARLRARIGPRGPQGQQGEPGTPQALGYGFVLLDGSLSSSKNVLTVTKPEVGVYCITAEPAVDVKNIQASTATAAEAVLVQVGNIGACPGVETASVRTFTTGFEPIDASFYFLLN
jgi:hypothetical protein